MIISRFYIPLIELYNNDEEVRALIDEFFADESIADDIKECYRRTEFYRQSLSQREMGWCVPGDYLERIMDLCTELDKTEPYDNGLHLYDTNKVVACTDYTSDEDAVGLILMCSSEGLDNIVQRLKLKHENGKYEVEVI